MNLVQRPEVARLLLMPLIRELYYWLTGKHGAAIRASSTLDVAARRVARAVALISPEFARALPGGAAGAARGNEHVGISSAIDVPVLIMHGEND